MSNLLNPADLMAGRAQGRTGQCGEDGVLNVLLAKLGITGGYVLDLGCGGIGNSNTRHLIDAGWMGLLIDGVDQPPPAVKEWLTPANINQVLDKFGCPNIITVLSLDLDGNDWHIFKALNRRAGVAIVEINSNLDPDCPLVMPEDPANIWRDDDYYSATFAAWAQLAEEKAYAPVCVVEDQNLFLVDKSTLSALNLHPPAPADIMPKLRIVHKHRPGANWMVP